MVLITLKAGMEAKVVGKQTGTTWLVSRLDLKGIFRYFQGGSVEIFG
jgi:hypothetical protein